MVQFQQHADGFDTVLHVAHREWHGIRQASAYSPGNKLLIAAQDPVDEDGVANPFYSEEETFRRIGDGIERLKISHVVFQGYSNNADHLLLSLRSRFGADLRCVCVNHVTTAQFDNPLEMPMLERLFTRLRYGTLDGLASVKPGFSQVFPEFWGETILNFAPNLPSQIPVGTSDLIEAYAPLAVDWRKNIYTNVLAGELAKNVDRVKVANMCYGLDTLMPLTKLRYVGFLRDEALFFEMSKSTLVLLATLAECQPMTQLEAMAVGTPALTGPLRLAEFADDELTALTTTYNLDSPSLLATDIERLVDACKSDPDAMQQSISYHLNRRHALAADRYREFLRL